MAVIALWLMDASINVSMEPFRAFVGDKLDASQQTTGFADANFLYRLRWRDCFFVANHFHRLSWCE